MKRIFVLLLAISMTACLSPFGVAGAVGLASGALSLASDQDFRHNTKGRKGVVVSIQGFRGEGYQNQPTAQATIFNDKDNKKLYLEFLEIRCNKSWVNCWPDDHDPHPIPGLAMQYFTDRGEDCFVIDYKFVEEELFDDDDSARVWYECN